MNLFLEKGYKNTTMEDIVAATSLSKGGLYHYYGSTKEIIFAIMREGNNDYLSRMCIDPEWEKPEVCDYFAKKILEKIFFQLPQKKLYLIFCMEIMHDKDFEVLYKKLEEQTFLSLQHCFEKLKKVRFLPQQGLDAFSKIINAFLFVQNLFSDPEVLEAKQQWVYRLCYEAAWELFEEIS